MQAGWGLVLHSISRPELLQVSWELGPDRRAYTREHTGAGAGARASSMRQFGNGGSNSSSSRVMHGRAAC